MTCGLVVAVTVWLANAATASAERKYRVRIISKPKGATVYVNSRQTKPVGKTPINLRLPSGNQTVILELDDYQQLVESIYVKKRRWGRQTFRLKLKEIEYGFVEVAAANDGARGADILVDGNKSGIVPRTVKMAPGPHQVEVVKKGYHRFEKWIEIEADGKTDLPVKLVSKNAATTDTVTKRKKRAREKPATPGVAGTGPILIATAGVEIGWRMLRYRNAQTANLRPFNADHVGLLHVRARLLPLAKSTTARMRPLALTGEVAIAAPLETNTIGGSEAIETNWRELDIGARYAVSVSDKVALALGLGYGATQFTFTNAGSFMDSVPEVNYRYVRLGGELVYRNTKLTAAVGGAWLPILSTGVLADRFSGVASAGMKISADGSYALTSSLAAEISAFYRRYAHNFSYDTGAVHQADGADDHFFGVTLGVRLRAF